MAAGTYDANGIYQYGESDPIALFSDLLNLGQESTSDAFTDDRARIAFLEQSVEQASTFIASSSAARDSYWGVPSTSTQQLALQNKGARTVRTDTGYVEQYFAVYNSSTNPGGRDSAGWYITNRQNHWLQIPLKAANVTLTGGSGTFNSMGEIYFGSGTTKVNLKDTFVNSRFNHYKIVVTEMNSSTAQPVEMRLSSSGTESTTTYAYGGYFATSYSGPGAETTASDKFRAGYVNPANYNMTEIDIYFPNKSLQTNVRISYTGGTASGIVAGFVNGTHQTNAVFDGVSIYVPSGSFNSARLAVFGYTQ